MKKILFVLVFSILFFTVVPSQTFAVRVKGYTKSNGTYVEPYYRSNPNGLKYDNYSYKGGSLYNKSYGKYDTYKWNAPSYNWQPDYYLGKSFYDSKLDY